VRAAGDCEAAAERLRNPVETWTWRHGVHLSTAGQV
jgi:hypothetical protein